MYIIRFPIMSWGHLQRQNEFVFPRRYSAMVESLGTFVYVLDEPHLDDLERFPQLWTVTRVLKYQISERWIEKKLDSSGIPRIGRIHVKMSEYTKPLP